MSTGAAPPDAVPELPPALDLPFDVNEVLGPLVWGTFFATFLLMLFCVEAVKYWTGCGRKDRLCLRLWVLSQCILLPVHTVSCTGFVYEFNVMHWGDIAYVGDSWHWPLKIYNMTCGLAGVSCQTFLLYRLWKLCSSRIFAWFTVVPLSIIVCVQAAAFIAIVVRQDQGLSKFNEIFISLWFSSSAAVDLAIAAALLYTFSAMKKRYTATSFNLRLFGLRAMVSGGVTAVHALIVLIIYLSLPASNVSSGAAASLPCVYGITMLMALNYRHLDAAQETISTSGNNHAVSLAQSIRLEHVREVHRTSSDLERAADEKPPKGTPLDAYPSPRSKPFADLRSNQSQRELRWE